MFENPRTDRQAKNFTTNVSKTLDVKSSSSEQIFSKIDVNYPSTSDHFIVRVLMKGSNLIWAKPRYS